jgi:hypothetical protein
MVCPAMVDHDLSQSCCQVGAENAGWFEGSAEASLPAQSSDNADPYQKKLFAN